MPSPMEVAAAVEVAAAAVAVAGEPVAVEAVVVEAVVVELAPAAVELEQELVPGLELELAAVTAPAAEATILSEILTPVHTFCLTRTGRA